MTSYGESTINDSRIVSQSPGTGTCDVVYRTEDGRVWKSADYPVTQTGVTISKVVRKGENR